MGYVHDLWYGFSVPHIYNIYALHIYNDLEAVCHLFG